MKANKIRNRLAKRVKSDMDPEGLKHMCMRAQSHLHYTEILHNKMTVTLPRKDAERFNLI